ncbi:YbaN family protein [Sphingomonas sp. C3-2]|nr:YbaN family protein [Sphingomonas sp. C3-2]
MVRPFYLVLGLLLVALGVIGAFLPLLPTTIFLILAAFCFSRSSVRLEKWLHEHPRFGPPILAWQEEGAISRRSKIAACTGMVFGFGLFLLTAHPTPWLIALVALSLLGSAFYVVSRPLPRHERSER